MKRLLLVMTVAGLLLTACGSDASVSNNGGSDETSGIYESKGEKEMYQSISAEEAKKIMDENSDYVLLDVREQEEYTEGHIPGAMLIPLGDIEFDAEERIPDKDKLIQVYCRSGRRSKIAAQSLAEMGYTNIKEIGGIIDWPYDIEV